jgi:hypothetical protein
MRCGGTAKQKEANKVPQVAIETFVFSRVRNERLCLTVLFFLRRAGGARRFCPAWFPNGPEKLEVGKRQGGIIKDESRVLKKGVARDRES